MADRVFDTLSAARDLESAGLDRAQAEAIATVVRSGQGELVAKAELALLEVRLTWRIVLIAIAQTGLVVALLKLL